MSMTTESLKRAMADNAAASARVARATEEIRKQAEAMLAGIEDRLAGLRARAMSDEPAGAEYQALIRERGELMLVLGRGGVDGAQA